MPGELSLKQREMQGIQVVPHTAKAEEPLAIQNGASNAFARLSLRDRQFEEYRRDLAAQGVIEKLTPEDPRIKLIESGCLHESIAEILALDPLQQLNAVSNLRAALIAGAIKGNNLDAPLDDVRTEVQITGLVSVSNIKTLLDKASVRLGDSSPIEYSNEARRALRGFALTMAASQEFQASHQAEELLHTAHA